MLPKDAWHADSGSQGLNHIYPLLLGNMLYMWALKIITCISCGPVEVKVPGLGDGWLSQVWVYLKFMLTKYCKRFKM